MLPLGELQPLNIFFNVNLEGTSGQKIFVDPEQPMSLNVELVGSGKHQFSFMLYDHNGEDVEQWVLEASDWNGRIEGQLSWGYTNRSPGVYSESIEDDTYVSEIWNMIVTRYAPTFGRNYLRWEFEGYLTKGVGHTNTTPLHGDIEKILKEYCQKYDLILELEPLDLSKMKVPDPWGLTTEYKEPRFHKNSNETDFQFVKRICEDYLINYAGKNGYHVEHQTRDEQDYLVVRTAYDKPVYDTYLVQDPKTTVVEWNPDVEFAGIVSSGGGASAVSREYQSITGIETAVTFGEMVTEDIIPEDGNYSTQVSSKVLDYAGENFLMEWKPTERYQMGLDKIEPFIKLRGNRSLTNPSQYPNQTLNRRGNQWVGQNLDNWWTQNSKDTATLVIMGDPRCQPGKLVDVVYHKPTTIMVPPEQGIVEGNLHWTTGRYFIDSVSHSIGVGSYLTTLNLVRWFFEYTPSA